MAVWLRETIPNTETVAERFLWAESEGADAMKSRRVDWVLNQLRYTTQCVPLCLVI